jgi:hypothetical protein
LAVDGLAWAKTIAAIRRFQNVACGFKWPDGRIDPGGKTWKALVAANGGPGGGGMPAALSYVVPGNRTLLAQPTSMSCWATAYTMMRSWRDRTSYDIPGALAAVDQLYVAKFLANLPLYPNEVKPFVDRADMVSSALVSIPIEGWHAKLQQHGLIMIGAFFDPIPHAANVLHIRVVEGLFGNGTPHGTSMMIMDPDRGRRYCERFDIFNAKYELVPSNQALPLHVQVAHF